MKRKLEEETVNLIGRSAAERSLDRFYNRQRAELKKIKSDKDESSSLFDFNKVIPFPEVSKSEKDAKAESEPKVNSEPVKRTLKEVLSDLSKKHIPNRNKFAKSVSLLAKLSTSFFRDSYKTEPEVTYVDFLSVFSTVNDVFVKEFSGTVPKDCFDEKASLVSLTEVIDYIIDSQSESVTVNRESECVKRESSDPKCKSESESASEPSELKLNSGEILFLKFLKMSFGYPSSLWYENDPFSFHNTVNTLKRFFEDFLEDTKTGFVLKDITRVNNDPFELPTRDELLSLQLKAFVRTLGVVFCFFEFPWSKSSLVPLFSLVYLKRHVFEEADQSRISTWQSHINARKSKGAKSIMVQSIGESSFEVRDGRDEKVTSVHGSQVWTDRQLRL
ncbi:hypothetical protein MACK_002792 [Theileria orientalis]|uniref:Uncharacterized protein n=1 Tax=Theileria orientalis TaxID=68886 RepID=A0A976QVR6_THEOR|nr:hypothetical protein MACK_002792 [Theileria orientalis]